MFKAQIKSSLPPFPLSAKLELKPGQITAVTGFSGTGKTTLLESLCGFRPCQGRITLGESVWQDSKDRLFLPPHRRQLGYIMQNPYLFAHKSVFENLTLGYKPTKSLFTPSFIMKGLCIHKMSSRPVASLSGGEKQRVALGRALLSSPQALFLDEPFRSLDPAGALQVLSFFLECQKKLALPTLFVSHSLSEVARIADKVAIIRQGRLVFHGSLQEAALHEDFPLSPPLSRGVIWVGEVAKRDFKYQLSCVKVDSGPTLWLTGVSRPEGAQVAMEILASDVSLSKEVQTSSSILNSIKGTLLKTKRKQQGICEVHVRCEQKTLTTTITEKSYEKLSLKEGMPVYCHIKATAI